MRATTPRRNEDVFSTRGREIFERDIAQHLGDEDPRHFVLIDVETGDYEVDADEMAASDRLLARRPDAKVWMRRVGSPYAYRFGFRPPRRTP
jgi:hypothetical protein